MGTDSRDWVELGSENLKHEWREAQASALFKGLAAILWTKECVSFLPLLLSFNESKKVNSSLS